MSKLVPYFFFFNDTATTEIYTLSLHDALPILAKLSSASTRSAACRATSVPARPMATPMCASRRDRKSTRLNSSHLGISYAVFCLKKKKQNAAHYGQIQVDTCALHDNCTYDMLP